MQQTRQDTILRRDVVAPDSPLLVDQREPGAVRHAAIHGIQLERVEAEIVADAQRLRPDMSEVERLLADATKARRLLTWEPSYGGLQGLKRGIAKTVSWFVDSANLARYKPDMYAL